MPKHDALKLIFTKVEFDWLSEKYGQADLSIFMVDKFKLAMAGVTADLLCFSAFATPAKISNQLRAIVD